MLMYATRFDLSQPPPMITQTHNKEQQAMASASTMYNSNTLLNTAHQSPFRGSNDRITANFPSSMNPSPLHNGPATSSSDARPRPGSAILPDQDLPGGSHTPALQHSSKQTSSARPQGNDRDDLRSYASFDFAQSSSTMPPAGYMDYTFPTNQFLIPPSGTQSHNPSDSSHTASSWHVAPPIPDSDAQFSGSTFAGTPSGDFDPDFVAFIFEHTGVQLTVPSQSNGQGYLPLGSSASGIASGPVTPAPSEYEATLSRTHTPLDPLPMNAFPMAIGGGYNSSANHFPADLTASHTNTPCDASPNTGIPTPDSHKSHSSPMVPPSVALGPDYQYIPFEAPSYGDASMTVPSMGMGATQETPLTMGGTQRSTNTKKLNHTEKSKALPKHRGPNLNVSAAGEGPASEQSAGPRGATFPAALQSVAGVWGPVSATGENQWSVQTLRFGPQAGPPDFNDAQAHEDSVPTAAQRKSVAARARKQKHKATAKQAVMGLPDASPWLQYRADADDYVFICKFGECATTVADTFRTKDQAERHLKDVHELLGGVVPKDMDKRKCEWPGCTSGREFAASSIRRHVLHQHSMKPMQCAFPPRCGFRYKRPEDMKNHFQEKHMADYKRMIAERSDFLEPAFRNEDAT